ncbi:hypothetical protein Dimus_025078, partial [Dionaea muscipula]
AAPYNAAYIQYIEGVQDLSIKIDATITFVEASRIGEGFIGAFSCAAACGYDVAPSQAIVDEFTPSQLFILDPNMSQTKGRKNDVKGKEITHCTGRIKSGIEMDTQGRKKIV